MHRRLDPTALDRAAQGKPVTYVYSARALRDFGDGFVAVLLPVYLTAMGLGALEVGIVATLALLGSALMTLGIGLLGARTDQRKLLMAASGLMIATGLAFAASSTYGVVLLVALFGTINPSAGSVSIFVPLEHAVLSRSVADGDRTQDVCALQPDRCARRGRRRARIRKPGCTGRDGRVADHGAQGHVRRLRRARHRRRLHVRTHSCRKAAGCGQAGRRARALARHRLQDGGLVQRRCLRRRLRRAVAGRVVAVQQVRPFACGCRPLLLLDGRAGGVLVSGRGLAVARASGS